MTKYSHHQERNKTLTPENAMSCKECDEAQEPGEIHSYYYRIESGNVQVKGCKWHVRVMFERLRYYGTRKEEADNFGRPLIKSP